MENIAQCWMSMKEKQIFSSHFRPALTNCNNSWEESAFAKDMRAGIFGGCMWPPRFYSCAFCQREFKSAQALGGHMNVHRRDRARLKQYPNSPCSESLGNQGQLNCSKSLATRLSTKVAPLNPQVSSTPDPSSVPSTIMSTNTFPSSNAEVLSTMEHFMMSQYSSAIPREQNRKSCCNSHSDNNDDVLKLLLAPTYSKLPPDVKAASEEAAVRLDTNFSVAVSSSVEKRSPAEATIDEAILHKRHKISYSSPPNFVLSSCSSVGRSVQSADVILGGTPAGIEDLDLELRLGDPQRVL